MILVNPWVDVGHCSFNLSINPPSWCHFFIFIFFIWMWTPELAMMILPLYFLFECQPWVNDDDLVFIFLIRMLTHELMMMILSLYFLSFNLQVDDIFFFIFNPWLTMMIFSLPFDLSINPWVDVDHCSFGFCINYNTWGRRGRKVDVSLEAEEGGEWSPKFTS